MPSISALKNNSACLRNLALGTIGSLLASGSKLANIAEAVACQLDAGPKQFSAVSWRQLRVKV